MRISRLFSGDSFLRNSLAGPFPQEPLSRVWQELRNRNPNEFTVSRDDVARWYQFQVDESEFEENALATIFYLEHLKEFRPDDESIPVRLAYARQMRSSSTK